MKKLDYSQRLYLSKRSRRLCIYRKKRREQRKQHRRDQLAVLLGIDISAHGISSRKKGNRAIQVRLPVPDMLSLSQAHDSTIEFFAKLRQLGLKEKRRVYIDFRGLRVICPRAALMLAAEIDRWRLILGFRPWVKRVKQWDRDIARLLDEMGLFDVINASNRPIRRADADPDMVFIRFRSENQALGERASELATAIEQITGEQLVGRSVLFRGLSEAMTNVANHAYPEGEDYDPPVVNGQWWMFASFRKSTRRLTIALFDQGVGIPKTLPRVHTTEVMHGILASLGLTDDDASRITAATRVGRSRTAQPHRGKGLKDMKRYTHMVQDGVLRILSGKGEYVYHSNGTEERVSYGRDIGGTLIQWDATI